MTVVKVYMGHWPSNVRLIWVSLQCRMADLHVDEDEHLAWSCHWTLCSMYMAAYVNQSQMKVSWAQALALELRCNTCSWQHEWIYLWWRYAWVLNARYSTLASPCTWPFSQFLHIKGCGDFMELQLWVVLEWRNTQSVVSRWSTITISVHLSLFGFFSNEGMIVPSALIRGQRFNLSRVSAVLHCIAMCVSFYLWPLNQCIVNSDVMTVCRDPQSLQNHHILLCRSPIGNQHICCKFPWYPDSLF